MFCPKNDTTHDSDQAPSADRIWSIQRSESPNSVHLSIHLMATSSSDLPSNLWPRFDVPWVNGPVLFTSGPFANQWVRYVEAPFLHSRAAKMPWAPFMPELDWAPKQRTAISQARDLIGSNENPSRHLMACYQPLYYLRDADLLLSSFSSHSHWHSHSLALTHEFYLVERSSSLNKVLRMAKSKSRYLVPIRERKFGQGAHSCFFFSRFVNKGKSDQRPLGPSTIITQSFYVLDYPYDSTNRAHHDGRGLPIPPPRGTPETLVEDLDGRHANCWVCFSSLFQVEAPTREVDAGRVGVLPDEEGGEYGVMQRPKKNGARWIAGKPFPMTAVPASHPQFQEGVEEAVRKWLATPQARELARNVPSNRPSPTSSAKDTFPSTSTSALQPPPHSSSHRRASSILLPCPGADLSDEDLAYLEPFLPRELPKFVDPDANMSSRLNRADREVGLALIDAPGADVRLISRVRPRRKWMVYVFNVRPRFQFTFLNI